MGNAFTAVADDEEALFYNPAGADDQAVKQELAGVPTGPPGVLPNDAAEVPLEPASGLGMGFTLVGSKMNSHSL